MLAKKRALKRGGQEIERTPLLVPSFSSKGFPEVNKTIKFCAELFDSATLVSDMISITTKYSYPLILHR
jgi:hypothetical protein